MTATMARAASAEYYLRQMASWRSPAEYYNAGIEIDGRWWNPDRLFDIGDDDAIDPYLFKRLHAGWSPDGARPLTRNAGSPARSPGLDLVFSADKSVTALWAMTRDDEALRARIETCHDRAVRAALGAIVRRYCALSRVTMAGDRRRWLPGACLAANFRHSTTRENDPHLHTHCVIFNTVQSGQDGRLRALDSTLFGAWKQAAGAIYHNALAAGLQRQIGVRVEKRARPDGFWRVVGIDHRLVRAWSKRQAAIRDLRRAQPAARPGGRTLGRRALWRQPATDCPGLAYHFARWFEEASRLVDIPRCLATTTGLAGAPDPDERRRMLARCGEAVEGLGAVRSSFALPDAVERTAHWLTGLAGPDAALQAALGAVRAPGIVEIAASADRRTGSCCQRYQVRARDADIREIASLSARLAGRSGYAVRPSRITAAIDGMTSAGRSLAAAQQRAVRRLASSPGGVTMLDAPPGVSRTATVAVIADLYRQADYRVLAVAEAFCSASAAGAAYGVEATTMAWVFRMAGKQPDCFRGRTLVIAGDVETLSAPRLCRLLQFGERTGAALMFVCGGASGLTAAHAVAMDPLRQALRPAQAVAAVARAGDHADRSDRQIRGAAAGVAGPLLHAADDAGQAQRALVADWARHVRNGAGRPALVLASSAAAARRLSSQMRGAVVAAAAAAGSRRIAVTRGYAGRRREACLSVAVGDHLAIGARNREHGLFFGDTVRVQSLSVLPGAAPGGAGSTQRLRISGADQYGRAVRFHADEICDWQGRVRLSHGYAFSVSAGAGLSGDRTFLLVDRDMPFEAIRSAVLGSRDGDAGLYLSSRSAATAVAGLWPRAETRAAGDDAGGGFPGAERDHIAALPSLELSGAGMRVPHQMARELSLRDCAGSMGWRKAVALHDDRIRQLERQSFRDGSFAELERDPAYRRFDRQRQATELRHATPAVRPTVSGQSSPSRKLSDGRF